VENPKGGHAIPEPVVLPDVATDPHPVAPAAEPAPVDVPKSGQGTPQEPRKADQDEPGQ
jgi:hypothetical protein